jgi:hypothetical protein
VSGTIIKVKTRRNGRTNLALTGDEVDVLFQIQVVLFGELDNSVGGVVTELDVDLRHLLWRRRVLLDEPHHTA